jgi:hypothetical protein
MPYPAHQRSALEDSSYLLLEWVKNGKMLSSSWETHRHDTQRQSNLYHSLAKILLTISSVHLPRIGPRTMNDQGIITLTNRPFSDLTAIGSRHSIPSHVPRVSLLIRVLSPARPTNVTR